MSNKTEQIEVTIDAGVIELLNAAREAQEKEQEQEEMAEHIKDLVYKCFDEGKIYDENGDITGRFIEGTKIELRYLCVGEYECKTGDNNPYGWGIIMTEFDSDGNPGEETMFSVKDYIYENPPFMLTNPEAVIRNIAYDIFYKIEEE